MWSSTLNPHTSIHRSCFSLTGRTRRYTGSLRVHGVPEQFAPADVQPASNRNVHPASTVRVYLVLDLYVATLALLSCTRSEATGSGGQTITKIAWKAENCVQLCLFQIKLGIIGS